MFKDLIGGGAGDMVAVLDRLILLGLVAKDLSFLVLAISFLLLVYRFVLDC
ncbi:hypothetical protein [Plesiomonas shigelloides]|uniref:hypothetical protein n=1 Tax=Plesiomonas shigelloides TaxID=703 RepID=UPI00387F1E10